MRKKIGLASLCFALLFVLCGCWNYRGLNEIAIVSGMAVDMDPASGDFSLLFETVDLTGSVKQSGPKTKLVEAKGKTIFDAVRNAKMRLEKNLYFGNNQILIISEELAKSGHIKHLLDWFLRDAELRETSHIIVSQEKTAAELLSVKGINDPIVGFEMERIITDDEKITSSTHSIMLYQVYDVLHSEGSSLTLPAFHKTINSQDPASEVNGTAVFKGENLVGYLTPLESKYLLFIKNEVEGGTLTFSTKDGGSDDISLEISENKTKISFLVEDEKLKFTIYTETRTYLDESASEIDALDKETITSLEAAAGAKLKQEIEAVIKKVQMEYCSDIFDFGDDIRRNDNKLWTSISGNWDAFFQNLDVTVNCKVNIVNSAYIGDTLQEGAK